MIIYNGVDFTETFPVKVDDIIVSPIQLTPVARQRAIQFGSEFVRMSGGQRTVTISFALLEMNQYTREQVMQDVRDWAKVGANAEYTLELPEFATRHLECACTSLPAHSYRQWWENKLTIVFTCFNNPYWTSNDAVEVPCGTRFSVGGGAQPIMTIERSGTTKLTNQTYTNGSASMTFTQIPAGSLVIDLNRQTAAIGKSSIMQYYSPTSTWIVPKVGANQYINGVGTVKYRERWV